MLDIRLLIEKDVATMKLLADEIERWRLKHPSKVVTAFAVGQAIHTLLERDKG